ncbi:uncharacterized protein LOC133793735 [Humulus lupulus]|uniref:uncharacterized protein LOC133793735 n=1 Tax=Humulus lupulus TaxID=3486 RepID=UPI002B40951F|nr:uncharacterized protein LOC133793735 [Humulus lupulus]
MQSGCEICGGPHLYEQCTAANMYGNMPVNQAQVQAVGNFQRPYQNPFSNTYNPGWRNHPNFSWRNNQGQQSQFQGPYQQHMPQQPMNQASSSHQPRPQDQPEKPNELQAALPQGNLPSNTVVNPKENCQAISLRNGKQVEQPSVQNSVVQNEELGEKSDNKANGVTEDHQGSNKCPPVVDSQPVQLHINIPFAEALEQMPSYVKFMKEILSKKRKMEEYEMVALTEECSAILQRKLPQKLRDPGSFTIPCIIGKFEYRSVKHPRGIIEDVLVKVDKFIFPADFIVLDMEEDMDVPIILGRPFLATGQALIDVQKGELTLRVQGEEVVFNVFKALKFANVNDNCFRVDLVEKAVVEINLTKDSLQKSLTIGDIDAELDSEVQEFGHKVSKNGIEVDRAKIATIENLPPPVSVKGVRSFLGHAGFYRRFIKDFSRISKPLSALLMNGVPFEFDEKCLEAFRILKQKLVSAPIVISPDWDQPFELMCDASDFAVGAVLGQRVDKVNSPPNFGGLFIMPAEH